MLARGGATQRAAKPDTTPRASSNDDVLPRWCLRDALLGDWSEAAAIVVFAADGDEADAAGRELVAATEAAEFPVVVASLGTEEDLLQSGSRKKGKGDKELQAKVSPSPKNGRTFQHPLPMGHEMQDYDERSPEYSSILTSYCGACD